MCIKNLSEFHVNKLTKSGYAYCCKSCKKKAKKPYDASSFTQEKRDILKKKKSEYYLANKEKILKRVKKYSEENKLIISNYRKQYAVKNAKEISQKSKDRYIINKEIISQKAKEKYLRTKEKVKERMAHYYFQNKDKINKKIKESRKTNKVMHSLHYKRRYEKAKSDPLFSIKNNLRHRVHSILRANGWKKDSKSAELIGTDYQTFKLYIERQFKPGMNWNNHSLNGWHIDHIIPLASAKTVEDVLRLCHFTNLQPLWSNDNIIKKDKIPNVQMKLTI